MTLPNLLPAWHCRKLLQYHWLHSLCYTLYPMTICMFNYSWHLMLFYVNFRYTVQWLVIYIIYEVIGLLSPVPIRHHTQSLQHYLLRVYAPYYISHPCAKALDLKSISLSLDFNVFLLFPFSFLSLSCFFSLPLSSFFYLSKCLMSDYILASIRDRKKE